MDKQTSDNTSRQPASTRQESPKPQQGPPNTQQDAPVIITGNDPVTVTRSATDIMTGSVRGSNKSGTKGNN